MIDEPQMKMLRAPFTVAAVKFRPLEKPNAKKVVGCLVYIDSRLAAERLSAVDPGWSSTYEVLAGPDQHMPVVCKLTVCGTTREGVGQNASPMKDDKHAKMAFSDAMKRAAVEFGVAASLYAMPRFAVDANGYWVGGNGKVGGLTPLGVKMLRDQYQRAIGVPEFVERYGHPIDHGDYLLPEEDAGTLPTALQEAEAAPRLDIAQLACLEFISAKAGHPGKDRSDLLAEDYPVIVRSLIEYACKQGVIDAADAPDVEAAALAGDAGQVDTLLKAGVAA